MVENKNADALINLYLCLALKKLRQIEKFFRNKDLILTIHRFYKQLKRCINETFYDKKEEIYYTFDNDKNHRCQLAQALAICSDVAPNKRKLRKKLATDKTMIEATLSTRQFVYEALAQNLKVYGDYILNDIRRTWGKMICEGADKFYETIEGAAAFEDAGSLCHGWSASPAYWYRILFGKNYSRLK